MRTPFPSPSSDKTYIYTQEYIYYNICVYKCIYLTIYIINIYIPICIVLVQDCSPPLHIQSAQLQGTMPPNLSPVSQDHCLARPETATKAHFLFLMLSGELAIAKCPRPLVQPMLVLCAFFFCEYSGIQNRIKG